jgi:outer membrane protein
MTFKPFLATAAAVAALLATSPTALAQTRAAAAPANPGPAISGVCIVNIEGAIGASTVGKYVNTRLQQLGAQVKAELTSEQSGIETEGKALQAQQASLDKATLDQRTETFRTHYNALQQKAALREREMQATEQKATSRILQEMDPLVHQAYAQKHCGLLLQRNAVVLANPAMDITPEVITALNAKITQFPFDREHLDQGAAVATVPGTSTARPATPTRK